MVGAGGGGGSLRKKEKLTIILFSKDSYPVRSRLNPQHCFATDCSDKQNVRFFPGGEEHGSVEDVTSQILLVDPQQAFTHLKE